MSRVGARREREGVVPRAGGRSLPSPIATDASGCRAYLVCRAGFAGRDTPLAQAIERYNSLSGPDPRCISGRLPSRPIAFPPGGRLDVTRAASALSTARDDDAARRGLPL